MESIFKSNTLGNDTNTEVVQQETEEVVIPEEFSKILKDFIADLKTTFPEYASLINKSWKDISEFQSIEDETERTVAYQEYQETQIRRIFEFCRVKYPHRFFDILYQNDEIFNVNNDVDTEFFPAIHFKNLWHFDITSKTRETIWKYLQLIMFSIVGTINNKSAFGDTRQLFEAIENDDFKQKLEDTMKHIQDLFAGKKYSGQEKSLDDSQKETNDTNDTNFNMPNPEKIHEHLAGMMECKLGKLAKEIAEESAANFSEDMENATDMNDIFQKLMNNPSKMMGLVKSVSEKLDSKIKSGEIKENEIISDATNLMNQMKSMGGMDNIQELLKKMGLSNYGAKVDTNAMEAQLNNRMKIARTKDRIRAKAESNSKAKLQQQLLFEKQRMEQEEQQKQNALTDEQLIDIFVAEEKAERSMRADRKKKTKK